MKTMKLTTFCLAFLFVLMFASCGGDDPEGLKGTKWEKRIPAEQINMMINYVDAPSEYLLPEGSELIADLYFCCSEAVELTVDIPMQESVLATPSLKIKVKMPYTYNFETNKVVLKVSEAKLLSTDPAVSEDVLDNILDIDFSEVPDVWGVVDWDQNQLTTYLKGEGDLSIPLVFSRI